MADRHRAGQLQRGERKISLLQTVLQTGPGPVIRVGGYGGGSFIFGAISAVSILIITVGVFYVLIKLGSFIDAMKEKTETSSAKK
ncbi:MAG: hypothetical protein ACLP5V_03960 [Candidatus Bathyarchaeia archaeon]